MLLAHLFNRPENSESAGKLYLALVTQARNPVFYTQYGVPDTVDGRFDMIALHAWLVMRRMKSEGETAARLSQALFDAFFGDMDRSLREMGAGDLGVGRRVKAMAKAFYGRVAAYDEALEDSEQALTEALHRNLFRGDASDAALLALSALAACGLDDLLAGNLSFGPPPNPSGAI